MTFRRAMWWQPWHYLRWPTTTQPHYTWIPDDGRPVASLIALG